MYYSRPPMYILHTSWRLVHNKWSDAWSHLPPYNACNRIPPVISVNCFNKELWFRSCWELTFVSSDVLIGVIQRPLLLPSHTVLSAPISQGGLICYHLTRWSYLLPYHTVVLSKDLLCSPLTRWCYLLPSHMVVLSAPISHSGVIQGPLVLPSHTVCILLSSHIYVCTCPVIY